MILSDVTLEHETAPELRMAIGHADAHVAQADTLRQTLVAVTLFVFAAAIAVLLSDRVGFRRDDDALSRLALVATFLGLVLLVAYPMYTSYVRGREMASDALLVAALGDRASLVRAMIRYADDDLAPLCDRRSVRWYFDETPPLGARIASVTGRADPCLVSAQSSATAAETAAP